MKKVIVFDTAIGTGNKGDDIIMESARAALRELLDESYVLNLGTHIVNYTGIQLLKKNFKLKFMNEADYKFIMGTNLLTNKLFRLSPQLNINPFNCMPYKNAILFGVGTMQKKGNPGPYTQYMYHRILSHKYIHSVRDDLAKEKLEKMGFKALNTGCPTLWCLTEELCKQIPTKKANQAILTVSANRKDCTADQKLIDTVRKNYEKVYLWGQWLPDEDYFNTFKNIEGIEIIRSLEKYHDILSSKDIDYVGTRLHGGIYAMQHRKRAIIIAVDHRSTGISENNHINCLDRKDIDGLDAMINSEFETKIKLQTEEITAWLGQFIDSYKSK